MLSITNNKFFIKQQKVVNIIFGSVVMIKNLKQLRIEKGISQQQLAEVIGVSQQSINKYENHGVEPDIETLIKISDYFNTSVDYLIGHTQISRVIEETSAFDLNQKEAQVIQRFRSVNHKQKDCVLNILDCFSQN